MTALKSYTTATSTVAWVVFSDQAPIWWAKILKNGFRHCFMVQRDGASWCILDPFTHPPKRMHLPLPGDFDLPKWLQSQGLTVLAAESVPIATTQRVRFGGLRVLTRALGLGRFPIFTPWQLYRRLIPVSFPSNPLKS